MSHDALFRKIREEARSGAERKVAAVLLEGYPARVLTTVEGLADLASVSAPTVLRFLSKIGFPRFADFQASAIADVERQLGSPLDNLVAGPRPAEPGEASVSGEAEHIYRRTLALQVEALSTSASQVIPAEFDLMANLIANPKAQIKLIGGRYSYSLALRLANHLTQIRPGVSLLPLNIGFIYDALVDAGPRDVFVIFDFRRYQEELLRFAEIAHGTGAKICLFTDVWRSPIAEYATAVLAAPDNSTSPFGSSVVSTVQIEAIGAAVIQRTLESSRKRLARIEEIRRRGTPEAP